LIATAAHSDTCLNTTAPGYFGFIPAGGLFAAAVADFTADVFNRYTGLKETAPALVQLEKKLLSWLGGSFGYDPSRPGGVFTSGGSLATFTAIVAARNMRRRRLTTASRMRFGSRAFRRRTCARSRPTKAVACA